MPALMPENEQAMEVYGLVRGQVITAGLDGTLIDVSIPALKVVLDELGIGIGADDPEARRECFLKVIGLARHMIKHERETRGDVGDG